MHNGVPAIQQLPPEVLTVIFLYAVHSSPCFANPSGLHPLLLITSTCSQWRQLAIEIRTLWNHVDIDAADSNEQRSLRLLERTRLWLERARGVPLHVRFLTDLGNEPRRAVKLVPVLRSHAASISSLMFLRGINIPVTRSLFALWQDQAEHTLLETLVLKGAFPSRSLCWPTTLQGFTNLQLLNLYEVHSPTLEKLVNMISGSPRLHTLRLRNMSVPYTDSDYNRARCSVSLPCLRMLDIASLDLPLLSLLLALLSPGPLALDLRLLVISHHTVLDVLLPFFDRSNITSLYLVDTISAAHPPYAAAPPFQWFPHLSQLRILFLSCGRREGAQLEHLVFLADGKMTALAPNLHTLVLLDFSLSDLARRRVECVVNAYSLRRLIFRASLHIEGFSMYSSFGESGVEVLDEEPYAHDTEFNDFKDWLDRWVNIVMFGPQRTMPYSLERWDTYMQDLISGLDA